MNLHLIRVKNPSIGPSIYYIYGHKYQIKRFEHSDNENSIKIFKLQLLFHAFQGLINIWIVMTFSDIYSNLQLATTAEEPLSNGLWTYIPHRCFKSIFGNFQRYGVFTPGSYKWAYKS